MSRALAAVPTALPTELPSPPAPTADYSPAAVEISPGPEALVTFDWRAPQPVTVAGWTLRDCDGDAPLVCVTGPAGESGTVEVLSFPLATLPQPVTSAAQSGDVEAALRAHADAYLAEMTADRAQGCGAGYAVTPASTAVLDLRSGRVARYGFSGGAGGAVSERTVQYAAVRGDSLVLLDVEAQGDGGCVPAEGDALTPAELSAFLPVLDAVVHTTPFPEA